MQDFIIYQIKAAVIMAVFYMFFRLFLSKETFHRFNRIVLLGTTLASCILPLCVITINSKLYANRGNETESWMQLFSESYTTMQAAGHEWYITLWDLFCNNILPIIYIAGCAVVLGKILLSGYKVCKIIRDGERVSVKNGNTLILSKKNISPFSWFKYIVINTDDYYSSINNGMGQILLHEKAHIQMRHSYDILFADMVSVLQWFNPALWMLKSDLRAIHEFEADDKVLSQGVNVKQYQYLLIKKAVGASGYSIANSFNHSTLKNRITMMLQTKSSWKRALKALYIIPVAGISLVANAQSKITIKELNTAGKVNEINFQMAASDTSSAAKTKNVQANELENPLYVIDGKKQSNDSAYELTPDDIASITVYKGMKAVSLYGQEAKDGVVIIVTKAFEKQFADEPKSKSENKFELNGNATAEPLVIVNGKEISNDEFKSIKPEDIESIKVLKGPESSKEYGEKGKNGVIQVKLKDK